MTKIEFADLVLDISEECHVDVYVNRGHQQFKARGSRPNVDEFAQRLSDETMQSYWFVFTEYCMPGNEAEMYTRGYFYGNGGIPEDKAALDGVRVRLFTPVLPDFARNAKLIAPNGGDITITWPASYGESFAVRNAFEVI